MPEIGTSGSMSEDGKRGVAKWPKLPRLSSSLPLTDVSPAARERTSSCSHTDPGTGVNTPIASPSRSGRIFGYRLIPVASIDCGKRFACSHARSPIVVLLGYWARLMM